MSCSHTTEIVLTDEEESNLLRWLITSAIAEAANDGPKFKFLGKNPFGGDYHGEPVMHSEPPTTRAGNTGVGG